MGRASSGKITALALLSVLAFGACSGRGRGGREGDGGGQAAGCGRSHGVELGEGKCLWLEHHGGQKYLNVCVRRAFEREAELTTEWRALELAGKRAPAVAPERLSHRVAACDAVSRESITVIVQAVRRGKVVLERL